MKIKSLNLMVIVGARPQFIKAAPIVRAIEKHNAACTDRPIRNLTVHTGQHYDYGMSQVFFDELRIPQADINLGVGSGNHGWQTGNMLIKLEQLIQQQRPDWVLVYGDTNSTLAGALAAVKLHVPVAHVEAGLRSFNREMPEEHNRVLTDHCSDLLFCPTQTAVNNLTEEGITQGVHLVGDTMYDAVLQFAKIAQQRSSILQDLGLESKNYLLATVHRPYNTDIAGNLRNIIEALAETDDTVIFPLHPRTRACLDELDLVDSRSRAQNLKFLDPVGYLDMLMLEQHARTILTDSGGMQKEAYFFGVPCVTLRPETEWVETVESGWNVLVGARRNSIIESLKGFRIPGSRPNVFGDGHAAEEITRILTMN